MSTAGKPMNDLRCLHVAIFHLALWLWIVLVSHTHSKPDRQHLIGVNCAGTQQRPHVS
ncbi:hypothetical protein [Pseudoxanthomonas mexicana]